MSLLNKEERMEHTMLEKILFVLIIAMICMAIVIPFIPNFLLNLS